MEEKIRDNFRVAENFLETELKVHMKTHENSNQTAIYVYFKQSSIYGYSAKYYEMVPFSALRLFFDLKFQHFKTFSEQFKFTEKFPNTVNRNDLDQCEFIKVVSLIILI